MVPSACKLFTGTDDPRVVGRITHSLAEILFAALCATLCGFGCCDGYAQWLLLGSGVVTHPSRN